MKFIWKNNTNHQYLRIIESKKIYIFYGVLLKDYLALKLLQKSKEAL